MTPDPDLYGPPERDNEDDEQDDDWELIFEWAPPPEAPMADKDHPWTHRGCGQPVMFDLSGGYCLGCHAEGLGDGDVNPPEETTDADG